MQDQNNTLRTQIADGSREASSVGRCSNFHRLRDLADARNLVKGDEKQPSGLKYSETAANTLQEGLGAGLMSSFHKACTSLNFDSADKK